MEKTYTIHDLPDEDRPRERLRKVGLDNLSIQELLALVIEKGGGKGQTVLTTAQKILARFGNLHDIKKASLEELKEVKGIGFATACKLQAAFKIGAKAQFHHKQYTQKIESSEEVFNLLKNTIGNKKKEYFKLLSLNTRNKLISIDTISIGTVNTGLAHPREIFKVAIKNSAVSVILAHNHPSGIVNPSNEDKEFTKKLRKVAKLLNIELLDHIIITADKFKAI